MTSESTAINFSIIDWAGWRPGVLSRDQWRSWEAQGVVGGSNQLPDFKAIPPMIRRRLSTLGRTVFHLMDGLTDAHGAMPIVYASQHGEFHRTTAILDDIAVGNPVSPAAFSLSVHNSISAVFSIHHGIKQNITAIAAGPEGLVPALLESGGLLVEGHNKVLCVLCDEPLGERYSSYESNPAVPFAAAFVITAGDGYSLHHRPDYTCDESDEPQALTLIRHILSEGKTLPLQHNHSAWVVERNA